MSVIKNNSIVDDTFEKNGINNPEKMEGKFDDQVNKHGISSKIDSIIENKNVNDFLPLTQNRLDLFYDELNKNPDFIFKFKFKDFLFPGTLKNILITQNNNIDMEKFCSLHDEKIKEFLLDRNNHPTKDLMLVISQYINIDNEIFSIF